MSATKQQKGKKRIQKSESCPPPSKRGRTKSVVPRTGKLDSKLDSKFNSKLDSKLNSKLDSPRSYYFEHFINTPGLQHLAENIFLNLNYHDLNSCQLINRSSKNILKNPNFWLKKFIQRGLSKQNQNDWKKAIQLTRNTKLENNILRYLKRSLKHQKLVDLPCYIDKNVVLKSFKIVRQIDVSNIQNWNTLEPGYIQMFAALSKNPNALWYHGSSPISMAAKDGDVKFIKSLAPLTENPNQPDKNGDTPFHLATTVGRADINKYLGSLVDILPKTLNKYGETDAYSLPELGTYILNCCMKNDDNFLEMRPYLEIYMNLAGPKMSKKKSDNNLSKRQLMTISFVLNGMLLYIDNVLKPHVKKLSQSEKEKFEQKFAKFLEKTWYDAYGSFLWNNQDLSNEQLSDIALSLSKTYICLENLLKKIEENCEKSSSVIICKLVETQVSK